MLSHSVFLVLRHIQASGMNSLNRQLIKLFKEKLRLRKDYLKYRLNLTEENGECKMLTLLFMKLAFRSNPTGWNSSRSIKCMIRLKWKRAGCVNN